MDQLWTHSMKHYLIMSKLCLRIIYLQELQETGLPVSLTKEHL